MTEHRLDPLLQPRSVALLGASDRAGSPGAVLADLVINSDFAGEVFPVNPRCEEILGKACYPDLQSLPLTVEHVVIALGNAQLEAALEATIEHGARAATIYSSGVLEADSEPDLKQRLRALLRDSGLQVCGLNGMGFYNPGSELYLGIFPRPRALDRGGISYIAQSGSAFTTLCHNGHRLGFNLCVSSGNEIATTVADYMDWSLARDDTRVIALFLETVRDPQAFVAALEKANARRVPVVVLKIGKSPLGAKMAVTHTGAIAGSQAAFEALCRRYGVIAVDDFDEMAALLMLLQSGRVPGPGGFAAAFESGGFRELITDAAHELGLEFAPLDSATRDALVAHLDPGLEPDNPLDAWGSHERFEERFEACMELLMRDPNVAAGAFISNYRDGYYLSEAIFRAVEAVSRKTDKPIALATCYADLANDELCRRAYAAGFPLISGARESLLAFRRLFEYREFLRQDPVPVAPVDTDSSIADAWRERLAAHPEATLGEADALALFADFGIAVAPCELVHDDVGLALAAQRIGYPLVLKTAAPGVHHKSDSHGVVVDLQDETDLLRSYADLRERLGADALVSKMIDGDVEIALGIVNDAQFGPLLMVAAGGILVELLDDRAVALCPLDARQAETLLASLKADRLLRGVRGRAPANRAALIDAMVALSTLAWELQDSIAEIDINPVLVNPDAAFAVDALVLRKTFDAPC